MLFAVCCLFVFVMYCLWRGVCMLLCAVWRSLFWGLVFDVCFVRNRCVLFVGCCLLCAACCFAFVVCLIDVCWVLCVVCVCDVCCML